jgi:hypothetical protein
MTSNHDRFISDGLISERTAETVTAEIQEKSQHFSESIEGLIDLSLGKLLKQKGKS